MNVERLIRNIQDQIKESQVKLGYASETVRLYYTVESLRGMVGYEQAVTLSTGEEAAKACDRLVSELMQQPKLVNGDLGKVRFSTHKGRIEISIPPEGVLFVHQTVPEPKFLCAMIELFMRNHHATLDDIKETFERFDSEYECLPMPEEAGFDFALHFIDEAIDPYYYCVKEEMGHTIYHRFEKCDLDRMMAS